MFFSEYIINIISLKLDENECLENLKYYLDVNTKIKQEKKYPLDEMNFTTKIGNAEYEISTSFDISPTHTKQLLTRIHLIVFRNCGKIAEETLQRAEKVYFQDLYIVRIVAQSYIFVHRKAYLKTENFSGVLPIRITEVVVPSILYAMWSWKNWCLKAYEVSLNT